MVVKEWHGTLRQSDVQMLAAELVAALSEGDVTLDLGGVAQVDGGVVQVLIAASALADRTGARLHLAMPEGCAVWQMAQAMALPPIGVPLSDAAAGLAGKV